MAIIICRTHFLSYLPSVNRGVVRLYRLSLLFNTSFFESCPPADFYLLKYIVHDWPDEKATEILRNCRKAMLPNGKVLIMDNLIQEDNKPHFGKNMDILMLGSFDGGRERTEAELK